MPEIEGSDSACGLRPIIEGTLQACWPLDRGELGVDVPRNSAVSVGDRAIGPRWYSGVRDTVWELSLSSPASGWVTVKRKRTWW